MFCRNCLLLVASLIRLSPTSSQQVRSQVYSISGPAMCAADKPTVVDPDIRNSSVECAVQCTTSSCCVMYQLDAKLKQCQMYNYLPLNYSTDRDCITAYRYPPSVPDGINETCSFPFTFDGQLYYTCAVNYSAVPCDVFCLTSAQKPIKCTTEMARFVARNMTVNVTVPNNPGPGTIIPLMSVNGWLTILSRVNLNFPTGLTFAEYQSGFGDISSNFWLGLENIYKLTNTGVNGGKNYRLRFELLGTSRNRWYSEEFAWFYLESSSTSYILHASSTGTGDAGDSLNNYSTMNGKPFDLMNTYCALYYGPWWYTSYDGCCYMRMLGSASAAGFWYGLPIDVSSPLMVARMMIKQTN